jgi:hypothetical protein
VSAERARTRRMTIALRGSSSHERADIIRACANLEAAIGTSTSGATEPKRGAQTRGAQTRERLRPKLDSGEAPLRPPADRGHQA